MSILEEERYTILVVDDETDIRELFLQCFSREIEAGTFSLVFAHRGREALDILAGDPSIRIIILDIRMPEMDGFSFLDAVADRIEHLKVIMSTAYGDLHNIRSAMNRGAFDFLTKPLDLQDLRATVAKAVGSVRFDDERRRRIERLTEEQGILKRYFSADVANEIVKHGYKDRMIGDNHHATILFMDIRDFTSLSEKIPPMQVAEFLNLLYPDVMELILGRRGSINKIIGDAIVATFGVPFHTENDAKNAVESAVAIRDYVDRFNKFRPPFLENFPIRIGIGVTTGPVFAGNIGSFRRMEYTVIGDLVNTASRLQQLTKKTEVDILIDGATLRAAGDIVATKPVRVKSIRGKTERVDIHAVTGVHKKKTGFVKF